MVFGLFVWTDGGGYVREIWVDEAELFMNEGGEVECGYFDILVVLETNVVFAQKGQVLSIFDYHAHLPNNLNLII